MKGAQCASDSPNARKMDLSEPFKFVFKLFLRTRPEMHFVLSLMRVPKLRIDHGDNSQREYFAVDPVNVPPRKCPVLHTSWRFAHGFSNCPAKLTKYIGKS